MRFNPDNFFMCLKNVVTGKNGAGTSVNGIGGAQAADGGIQVDKPISLTDLINPTAEFPAITDSTGGTPSTTFAAITAGAGYAQADMVAVKNALSQIALDLNALHAANNTISSGKVPAYTVAAGSAPTVGIVSLPIPRDYDEASDVIALRLKIALANADAGITITGTPTVVPLGGAAVTGAAVSGKLAFTATAVNLSTTEQLVEVRFSGNGLKRDGLLAVTLALVGTTTGLTNITGIEWHYNSTVVSYNDTDQLPVDKGQGNPLR